MLMCDDYGATVFICGYAAIWDSLSGPFSDGHREFIDRRAFDSILISGQTTVRCLAHHDDDLDLGEAVIWSDATGLAFRSAPLLATVQNSAILGSIVAGGVRGVSWSGKSDMWPGETFQGMAVRRTRRVVHLDHVGPVGNPQYSEPGCWATCEDISRLPHRLQILAENWELSRAARHRHPIAAAAQRPRAPRQPDLPFAAYAGDPPRGMTAKEWEWFATMEAAGRRAMRPPRRIRAR